MKTASFERIITQNSTLLRQLREKSILLVTDCSKGILFDDASHAAYNAAFFDDTAASACETLLTSAFLRTCPCAVLIDFPKAAGLFQASGVSSDERMQTALLMSRINFMGTDGIRGKVDFDTHGNCIGSFLKRNALTPSLVEKTCFAFAELVRAKGIVRPGDTCIVGNDGRDAASDWRLNQAVADGFLRAGMNLLDLGVVPTACVPHAMLREGFRCGAMLTASHNPAHQNGVKFFIDGKKLLPEGRQGDYALSAYMFACCNLKSLPKKSGILIHEEKAADQAANLILSALPGNTSDLLKETVLVLDTANGASAETGKKVLDALEVPWSTKNQEPTGANINSHCGVSEIEGTELFEGARYHDYIPFIKEIFDKGRMHEPDTVYGISLDGDGDRGFLLVYDRQNDCVHVVDGDKCGFILAEYFLTATGIRSRDWWFVCTIESDIMVAAAARKALGLQTKIVSVGDKWIGNFAEKNLLVGVEVSGHVIFPVSFKDGRGMHGTLLSGIGLLTGLMTLVAVKTLRLPVEILIAPFATGFSKTLYTFFVDKTRFFKESAVWKSDAALIQKQVEAFKTSGALPAETELVFEDKEDPDVLYISLVNNQELLGCVFVRNSGTEDKTATYVKGKRHIKQALAALCTRVQENHIKLMKNEKSIELRYEAAIMAGLKEKPEVSFKDIKTSLENEPDVTVNENELMGVVYGLKREGRIVTRKAEQGDGLLILLA